MIASPLPRETLLHVVKTLPAAPQILSRLGKLLLDLDSGLDDITALLRRDSGLTAHIIRIANSALYNTGTPFASLEDALARVGLAEVYRLAGFAAMAQIADRGFSLYGISGPQMRENALLTALLMENLARTAGEDTRAGYTAGLLRSTGKIALDRLTRDKAYEGAYSMQGRIPLGDWETGFVGMNNCEAGDLILREWRFPDKIVIALRDHYHPTAESTALTLLLNLAAAGAERCGHGLPGEHFYWENCLEHLTATGLTENDYTAAMRNALERFGPVRAALA